MRLLAHLVRADVRHFRWLLMAWIAAMVAATLIEGVRPYAAPDVQLREAIAVAGGLFWVVEALLTVVLIALIVHAHPTVGTNAFWLTRPVPPGVLLAAKLLLLTALLIVLPTVADAVLLAVYHVPASIAAGVLVQSSAIQLVLVLLLAVGAAVTLNLARFAILCGAVILTVAAAIGIEIAITMASEPEWAPAENIVDEGPTELVVFNVLLVIAALLMLTVQYQTRLRRRSVAIGLAAVLAGTLISEYWPIPFLAPIRHVPAWAHDERQLTVAVEPGDIVTHTPPPYDGGRNRQLSEIHGRVRVEDVPVGWSAGFGVREATLRFPDGAILHSWPGPQTTLMVSSGGHELPPALAEDLLGVRVLRDQRAPEREARGTLFMVDQKEVESRGVARGEYRAVVRLTLTNYVIDGAIPLQRGAIHQNGGYRIVIDRLAQRDGQVAALARESRASSMWERRPWSQFVFYLRNRARAEAINVSNVDMFGWSFLGSILSYPFGGEVAVGNGTAGSGGFFARGIALSQPSWVTSRLRDQAWFEGAELVIVRIIEEGSVDRVLSIPDFPLGIVSPTDP